MANQGDGTFVQAARFEDSGTTEHILPVDLDGDGLLAFAGPAVALTSPYRIWRRNASMLA
jgi:hypothetical protein